MHHLVEDGQASLAKPWTFSANFLGQRKLGALRTFLMLAVAAAVARKFWITRVPCPLVVDVTDLSVAVAARVGYGKLELPFREVPAVALRVVTRKV